MNVKTGVEASIRLFHRRWSVPVISALAREGDLRFNELSSHMRASRDTLSETLTHLVAQGIVVRSGPGAVAYGLSDAGRQLALAARPLAAIVSAMGILDVALKKWPMMVLVVVGRGAERYTDIKRALPGITSGALAPALKDLEAAGLIARIVDQAYPPAPSYWLTARAQELFPALDALIIAAEAAPSPALDGSPVTAGTPEAASSAPTR